MKFGAAFSRLGWVALLCLLSASLAPQTHATDVIIDPSRDNPDLQECGKPGDAECPFDRVCAMDPNYDNKEVCLHKELLPDPSMYDYLGSVVILIGIFFASAGGIGGGGLLVPVNLLIFDFVLDEAIPLSHVTVFGNSMAQLVLNLPEANPRGHRLLIDFQVALLLLPSQLIGNNFGVIVSAVFPGDLLVFFSLLLLIIATYRVALKGISLRRTERRVSFAAHTAKLLGGKPQITRWWKYIPLKETGIIVAVWVLFSGNYFLVGKNGKSNIPGVADCSAGYWLLSFAIYPIIFAVIFLSVRLVSTMEKRDASDIGWSTSKAYVYVGASFCIGLVAGMLGIGGGEFMGPMLLELGLAPEAASATSAFLIVWTTSSNLVHYSTMDVLPIQYSIWFCFIAFCSALIGRFVALHFVKRYNKTSYVVIPLAMVLFASAALLAYRGTNSVVNDVTDGNSDKIYSLHSFCS